MDSHQGTVPIQVAVPSHSRQPCRSEEGLAQPSIDHHCRIMYKAIDRRVHGYEVQACACVFVVVRFLGDAVIVVVIRSRMRALEGANVDGADRA